MRLYFRFLFSLACGLLGVGVVLKVLLDTLFNDWDPVSDARGRFRAYLSGKRHSQIIRPEDALLEDEKRGSSAVTVRLQPARMEQSSDTLASINPS